MRAEAALGEIYFTYKLEEPDWNPLIRPAEIFTGEIVRLSNCTEVNLVLDNVLEIGSFGRQHHFQAELARPFEVALTNNTLDFLLRCYTDVLQEFAQR